VTIAPRPEPKFSRGDQVVVTDEGGSRSAAVIDMIQWLSDKACWTYLLVYSNCPGSYYFPEKHLKARV
jgi:hypothetical protein